MEMGLWRDRRGFLLVTVKGVIVLLGVVGLGGLGRRLGEGRGEAVLEGREDRSA